MSEIFPEQPITSPSDAVAFMGALPVPVGSVPQASERDRLRAAFVEALDNASRTHPCPALGDQIWSGCVHYDDAGHVSGVGSCHSERRADAVLAVRDVELDRLRAQVADLLAERHTTNEALSDAAEALRADRGDGCSCPPAGGPASGRLPAGRCAAGCRPGGADAAIPDGRMVARGPARLAAAPRLPRGSRPPGVLPSRRRPGGRGQPERVVRRGCPVTVPLSPFACRCNELDADPYACEAEPEDCSGEFSELNPFGGGPVHGHDAKVSRACGQCGFRTSVWHVDDGSAEEELHGHVVRVHGGAYPNVTTGGPR